MELDNYARKSASLLQFIYKLVLIARVMVHYGEKDLEGFSEIHSMNFGRKPEILD